MRKKLTLVASLAFAAALSAGVAGASISAQANTDWANFQIKEASVRLGNGTKENPSGLRFKIDAPVDIRGEGVECYTTLSFTTGGQSYTTDVPATYWRAEADGWNTALLEIPATDYTTEISATAYVKVNGDVVHTSNTATTSIAKTASIVMNAGKVDEKLDAYVAGAVSAVELSEETLALGQGASAQLTASLDEGYAVVWKSSDTSVATVDKDGNVTAVGVGSATITASVGNAVDAVKDTCAVTVSYNTLYDFENGATASPVLKVCNAVASDFEYTTVNGTTVLNANSGIYRVEGENRMKTFVYLMDRNYIDWAMTNHDYITYDFYATVPYMQYLRAERVNIPEGEESWSIYLYGEQYTGDVKHMKGEAVDGGLYRYSIMLNQTMYKAIKAKGDHDYGFRFAFMNSTNVPGSAIDSQVASDVLYLDNIQANDYTTDVIDFEDSNLHEFGYQWQGKTSTSVGIKERVAGDKALYVTGSGANNVGITKEYLQYAFEEVGAKYIEWKFYPDYPEVAPNTIAGASRIKTQNGEYNVNNAWRWIASEGYMLCRVYKVSYDKAMTGLNGADPTVLCFQNYVGPSGGYKAGGYMDDITLGLVEYTMDVIDFEDGKAVGNLFDYITTDDKTVASFTQVKQMSNGNWAMYVDATGANNQMGVSLEWLHWVFNVQKAQTISFKVYAPDGVLNTSLTANELQNRTAFFDGTDRWNYDKVTEPDPAKKDTQWFQTYDVEGQYFLCEIRANVYHIYFNTDGTPKLGWNHVGIATLYRPNGSNYTDMWVDDITIVK